MENRTISIYYENKLANLSQITFEEIASKFISSPYNKNIVNITRAFSLFVCSEDGLNASLDKNGEIFDAEDYLLEHKENEIDFYNA